MNSRLIAWRANLSNHCIHRICKKDNGGTFQNPTIPLVVLEEPRDVLEKKDMIESLGGVGATTASKTPTVHRHASCNLPVNDLWRSTSPPENDYFRQSGDLEQTKISGTSNVFRQENANASV